MASVTTQLLTADERLTLIQVKIERAKKHIDDLNAELRAFFAKHPYEVVSKKSSESGKLRYYLSRMAPVPLSLAVFTGDAIQNLRTALDHLAHHLLLVKLGAAATDEELNFPISNSAKDYESLIKRKVKRLRQDAIDALLSFQAYKGGKGEQIWVLNRLNNVDKHRLILTVSSVGGSAIISNAGLGRMMEQRLGIPAGSFPIMKIVVYPSDPTILKVGDEVFPANIDTWDTLPNSENQPEFHFYISFNEPQIFKGGPLPETLQHFADLVSNTVLLFKPCLS